MPKHLAPIALLLCAAPPALAQPILVNTQLTDTVAIPAPLWSAGNWGYRTATNRYLLQTLGSGGLAVVDTTDTSNAAVVGTVTGISVKEVKVYQNHAYATTDGGPTRVIDLSVPSAPVVVNSITQGAHSLQVDPVNGRLYLNRAAQDELRILNVAANPVSPPLIVTYAVADIHDCAPEGNTVYLWGGSDGMCHILDVSALPAITEIGVVAVNGGYLHSGDLYVRPNGQKVLLTCNETTGGHLKLWDVTNPAMPTFLSEWWTDLALSIHNVYVKGAYAYVTYYADGLRILDLTNPTLPLQVGIHDPNPANVLDPGFGIYTDAWDPYPYHDAVYVDTMFDHLAGAGYPQGAYLVDFFPAFGSGCPGTGGAIPEIWWSYGPPSPGNADFAVRIEGAVPAAPALLLLGSSATSWAGFALPLDLAALGAAGCTLYASPDVILGATTDGSGKASRALPVPPGVPAGVLWCQWAVFDPGAPNALDLAFTKGGKLIVE
jgi:hypothetical protein